MAVLTLETIRKAKNQAKESTFGVMEVLMKGIGRTIIFKEEESINGLMEEYLIDYKEYNGEWNDNNMHG